MMRQNNVVWEQQISADDLVISIYDESACVDEGLFSRIACVENVYCYRLICNTDILLQHFPNALHYLDRFWILLPALLKDQQTLWRAFYRLYSPAYNQLINRSHNLLCLRYFKQILEKKLFSTEYQRLLDFGCGVGLSSDVFDTEKLVCYDSNKVMQDSARERGLLTINERQFKTLSPNSFDGCIACYVLHLAISANDIEQLVRVLKADGIVVANFYKGMHVDRVNRIFRENRLVVEQIEDQQGRFGSIYVYRKQ